MRRVALSHTPYLGGSSVDPDNTPITVTRPLNTPGGTLKGLEINYQQAFTFLPGLLRHTGARLNYTYVDSRIDYFLAASYQINDHFKVSLEGLNIFDRFNRQYIDSDRDSTFVYTHTGRQWNLGVQYKF